MIKASLSLRGLAVFNMKSIIYMFPMSGNSFNPNDKSLANVEKKKNSMHTVDQFTNTIEFSKKKKPRSKKF